MGERMSVKKAKLELLSKLLRFKSPEEMPTQVNHGKPRSRREFLSQGMLTGAGYVFVPSIFALAERAALGLTLGDCVEDTAAQELALRMVRFDFGGGWTPYRAFPVGRDGTYTKPADNGSFRQVGLNTNDGAAYMNGLNTTVLGSGAPIDPTQPFWQGVMAVASAATLQNVGYEVIINANGDDTRDVGLGGLGHMVSAASEPGKLTDIISSRAGNGGTDGGRFNQVAAGQAGNYSVQVLGGANDIAGLVDAGKLFELFSNDKEAAGKVLKALTETSQSKIARMMATDDLNIIQQKLITCGYLRANENLVNVTLDPRNETAFQNVAVNFTQQNNPLLNGNIQFGQIRQRANIEEHMSRFWMAYSGNATYAVSEVGGHDNHGANANQQFDKMVEAGMQVGSALELAAQMNQPVMLGIATDGAQSGDGGSTNGSLSETRSDDETKGAYISMVYNPNGVKMSAQSMEKQSFQVGSVNNTFSVDRNSAPSANNSGKVVEHIVDTKLVLEGKKPKYDPDKVKTSNFEKLT